MNMTKNNMNMMKIKMSLNKKCFSYLAPDKDTLGYACMIHPHVVTMKTINAILWLICILSIFTEKCNENYCNTFNTSDAIKQLHDYIKTCYIESKIFFYDIFALK